MTGTAREPEPETDETPVQDAGAGAELAAAKAEAAERTADLQRITAEYANYRKRVERDRTAVVEAATGTVLAALLPVLDDVDRARAHGDLTGTFKAVADQLETALEKLGLQPFGAVGDPFDPMLHEAVAHQTSGDASVPSCVAVLRRGFKLGDRLLRPALVAVGDPPAETPAKDEVSPTDLPTADDAAADPDGTPKRKGGAHRAVQDDDEDEDVTWFGEGEQPEQP